jgi:hypothetical protein
MTRSAYWLLALASVVACASRHPQPVEPYSPTEPAESPSAALSAVASAAPPAEPSEGDVKNDECQKLGSTITANSEMLKGALDQALDPKAGKGALGKLATSVGEAGDKVKDLELKTPRLKSWSTEYQSLMSELSDALRQTEVDRMAKDKAAVKKDLDRIRSVDEREGDLVKRINAFCSG